MAYIGNSPGVASQRIVTTFTATASQTTFTPSSGYTVGYLDVYHNGVKLINGDDYTASNGTTFVLASGAASGDVIEAVAYLPRGLSDGYTRAEADARYMDINAVTLPTQTGNSGKYLTTDGSAASWGTVDLSTKVSKTGDTMTGDLTISDASGAWISLQGASSGDIPTGIELRNGATLESSWYVNPTHDTTFLSRNSFNVRTNNANRFSIDSSGRVTMPYQPAFLANGSKSKATSWKIISDGFTNTAYNTGGHYNTSNGRFTAPISGKYAFFAGGYIASYATSERYALSATVNNGAQTYITGGDAPTVDCPVAGYYVVYNLSAGDFVDLRMFTVGAVVIGAGSHTFWFGGYLIG